MKRAAALLAFILINAVPSRGHHQSQKFFQMSETEIGETLKELHARNPALPDRIEAVSEYFLGAPYRLGPLGEGNFGDFDRDPLINFKEADCTTLVEQVMALALKPDLHEAIKTLQEIRYRGGEISYKTRNHFPEVDWIPNNVAAGFIKDITRDIAADRTAVARKAISKARWYENKKLDDIQGFMNATPEEKQRRLKGLQALGKGFKDQEASVPYVPIALVPEILEKIPSGTIANLVREDKPNIPVLISHQVLIIVKDGKRYVRHASSSAKIVVDVPAPDYLNHYAASTWRLVGLNLNQVLDRP